MKVLTNLPTKINQDIKFVNQEDWKVYEHYKINGKIIMGVEITLYLKYYIF